MKLLLTGLAALLVACPALANEVWRTVDRAGLVVYSDRPLSTESVKVSVATQPVGASAAEAEPGTSAPDTGRRAATTVAADETARAEQAELVAKACRDARDALAAYENAPRLYQELPNGGRRWLTDEEMIATRQQAREAVAEFCTD
jgi:hypothetical protein